MTEVTHMRCHNCGRVAPDNEESWPSVPMKENPDVNDRHCPNCDPECNEGMQIVYEDRRYRCRLCRHEAFHYTFFMIDGKIRVYPVDDPMICDQAMAACPRCGNEAQLARELLDEIPMTEYEGDPQPQDT